MINVTKFSMYNIRKMISDYVKSEFDHTPIGNGTHKTKEGRYIFKSEKISKIVSRGIAIKRVMSRISLDLVKIDSVLKNFGVEKIRELNNLGEDVKSVRLCSTNDNLSVLIVERVQSLNNSKEKAERVKRLMGERFFEVFTEKESFSIKDAYVKDCLEAINKAFGEDFSKKVLNKKTTYSVSSKRQLDKLLSESKDLELKEALNNFIKPSEVAITYPK